MDDPEAAALDHPSAPERLVRIRQGSLAPVLHRDEREPEARHGVRLPPVVFLDAIDALAGKPRFQSERHKEERASRRHRGKLAHRVGVEVVVVVVGNEHDVDSRQRGHVDRERHDAARTRELHRGRALGELRIDQHVHSRDLQQEG